ncbi:hypothetical protein [Natronohydrobacter thiooxidans]|uniref:hypothetical protein n=1 Tax=Natronohydrobacter thiooxidans TaxID=87172 RepID=UPI001114CDE6|nr:hypothetical protein [Natronohydrobacter thiooxidans]
MALLISSAKHRRTEAASENCCRLRISPLFALLLLCKPLALFFACHLLPFRLHNALLDGVFAFECFRYCSKSLTDINAVRAEINTTGARRLERGKDRRPGSAVQVLCGSPLAPRDYEIGFRIMRTSRPEDSGAGAHEEQAHAPFPISLRHSPLSRPPDFILPKNTLAEGNGPQGPSPRGQRLRRSLPKLVEVHSGARVGPGADRRTPLDYEIVFHIMKKARPEESGAGLHEEQAPR